MTTGKGGSWVRWHQTATVTSYFTLSCLAVPSQMPWQSSVPRVPQTDLWLVGSPLGGSRCWALVKRGHCRHVPCCALGAKCWGLGWGGPGPFFRGRGQWSGWESPSGGGRPIHASLVGQEGRARGLVLKSQTPSAHRIPGFSLVALLCSGDGESWSCWGKRRSSPRESPSGPESWSVGQWASLCLSICKVEVTIAPASGVTVRLRQRVLSLESTWLCTRPAKLAQ